MPKVSASLQRTRPDTHCSGAIAGRTTRDHTVRDRLATRPPPSRNKDDVNEVREGFECGILLDGFNDVKEGDVIEAFETREIERTTLDQPPAPAVSSS